jgi:1-hydroxycarotenoid 3,4-desaturase
MADDRAIVIGAGIGGLAAALHLAGTGYAVTVVESAKSAGGKMREVEVDGAVVDAGPTVLTMRWVFDELFRESGGTLDKHVVLQPLTVLARHAWQGGAQLDLFSDEQRTADAIGVLAGAREAHGYLAFCREARRMYETLRSTFLAASKPNPLTLASRIGLSHIPDLLAIRPFDTMWAALGEHFLDPRLRQLFGRYATYCGSSPYLAPATLMLIAHVEQDGVWTVQGGMQRLAEGLAARARDLGAIFRFGEEVKTINVERGRVSGVTLQDGTRLESATVISNADPAALSTGLFGESVRFAVGGPSPVDRSLSAVTWAVRGTTRNFPLVRHNVFFSDNYASEFDSLFNKNALPDDPTIYVCAQDRDDHGGAHDQERMLVLVNAPAQRGSRELTTAELETCETKVFNQLRRCGLEITGASMLRTTPSEFNKMFPATGGALYGRATHGWAASFRRPGSRTRIPGLYLAGGGVHPGAGVPMAALSGRQAAQCALSDRSSTYPSNRAAMHGGTSTRSATTDSAA